MNAPKKNAPKNPSGDCKGPSSMRLEPYQMSKVEQAAFVEVVPPSAMDSIAKAGGYAAILADPNECLSFEDILEPISTGRAINVRNALRRVGWDTQEGKPDHSDLHKGDVTCQTKFDKGPSGHNVVSYSAVLKEGKNVIATIPDRLMLSTEAFAQMIANTAARHHDASASPVSSQNALAGIGGTSADLTGPEAYLRISPIIQTAVEEAMEQVAEHLRTTDQYQFRYKIRECQKSGDGFMATQDGGWVGTADFLVEDLESTSVPLPPVILAEAQKYRDGLEEDDKEGATDAMMESVTFEITGMVFSPDNYRNTLKTGQWEVLCFAKINYGETFMMSSQPERSHVNGDDVSIAVDLDQNPSVLQRQIQDAFTKAVAFLTQKQVLPLQERMTMEDRLATGSLVELTPAARSAAKKAQEDLKTFRRAFQGVSEECRKKVTGEAKMLSFGGLIDFNEFNEAASALQVGLERRELSGAVAKIPSLMGPLKVVGKVLGMSFDAHKTDMPPKATPFTKALSSKSVVTLMDAFDAIHLGVLRSAETIVIPDASTPGYIPGTTPVVANHEKGCYLIRSVKSDDLIALDFKTAERRAWIVADWLQRKELEPVFALKDFSGTADIFRAYDAAMEAGAQHHIATGDRSAGELSPQLRGLEGKRVEVVALNGEKRRFYVGEGMGWMPRHLEMATRRSMVGAKEADSQYKSVRVVNEGTK